MDQAGFAEERLEEIKGQLAPELKKIGYKPKQCPWIPYSAMTGDNLLGDSGSDCMPWYNGPTLLSALEGVELPDSTEAAEKPLRMPVRVTHKIKKVGTVLVGRIECGTLKVGSEVFLSPGPHLAVTVKSIQKNQEDVQEAGPGTTPPPPSSPPLPPSHPVPSRHPVPSCPVPSPHRPLYPLSLLPLRFRTGERVGLVVDSPLKDLNGGIVVSDSATDEDAPLPAKAVASFDAQLVVLSGAGGGDAISVGYSPVVDCHTAHVSCCIKTIKHSLDRKTGTVLEDNPCSVKAGDACIATLVPCAPM
jgi:elongation factor 1-alpha